MATVWAGRRRYEVDLVIFDKDGTLFDFRAMWARILRQQVDALAEAAGGDEDFVRALYADMGTDPAGLNMDPRGPLALATYEEMRVIMMLALYRRGWAWDVAQQRAMEITAVERWPALETLVFPIGDVAGLLGRMRRAGLSIGVATTDVRDMTAKMLALIGIGALVDGMACADDGVALKPAPDSLLALCRQIGVPPARALMVGDAPTDMLAGRAAGVAGCVGVITGVSGRADLEPFADVVLDSIQALGIGAELLEE